MEKIPYINTSIYFDDSFSSLYKYIDLDSSNVFLIVDSNIYDLHPHIYAVDCDRVVAFNAVLDPDPPIQSDPKVVPTPPTPRSHFFNDYGILNDPKGGKHHDDKVSPSFTEYGRRIN